MQDADLVGEGGLIDPAQAGWKLSEGEHISVIMINSDYIEACTRIRDLMWSVDKTDRAALLKRFSISRETVVRNLSEIMAESGRKITPE
ncbi:MAG: hypothetical protein ACREWG_15680 [Gammaproteobacteria bacterium]